eukprot:g189.t1
MATPADWNFVARVTSCTVQGTTITPVCGANGNIVVANAHDGEQIISEKGDTPLELLRFQFDHVCDNDETVSNGIFFDRHFSSVVDGAFGRKTSSIVLEGNNLLSDKLFTLFGGSPKHSGTKRSPQLPGTFREKGLLELFVQRIFFLIKEREIGSANNRILPSRYRLRLNAFKVDGATKFSIGSRKRRPRSGHHLDRNRIQQLRKAKLYHGGHVYLHSFEDYLAWMNIFQDFRVDNFVNTYSHFLYQLTLEEWNIQPEDYDILCSGLENSTLENQSTHLKTLSKLGEQHNLPLEPLPIGYSTSHTPDGDLDHAELARVGWVVNETDINIVILASNPSISILPKSHQHKLESSFKDYRNNCMSISRSLSTFIRCLQYQYSGWGTSSCYRDSAFTQYLLALSFFNNVGQYFFITHLSSRQQDILRASASLKFATRIRQTVGKSSNPVHLTKELMFVRSSELGGEERNIKEVSKEVSKSFLNENEEEESKQRSLSMTEQQHPKLNSLEQKLHHTMDTLRINLLTIADNHELESKSVLDPSSPSRLLPTTSPFQKPTLPSPDHTELTKSVIRDSVERVQELQREIGACKNQNTMLTKRTELLEQQNITLVNEKTALEEQLATAMRQVCNLEDTKARIKKEVGERQKKEEQLQQNVDRLENVIGQMKNEYYATKSQCSNLRLALKKISEMYETQYSKSLSLMNTLEKACDTHTYEKGEKLMKFPDHHRAVIKKYCLINDSLSKERDLHRDDATRLRSEKEKSDHMIRSHGSEITNLKGKITDLKQTHFVTVSQMKQHHQNATNELKQHHATKIKTLEDTCKSHADGRSQLEIELETLKKIKEIELRETNGLRDLSKDMSKQIETLTERMASVTKTSENLHSIIHEKDEVIQKLRIDIAASEKELSLLRKHQQEQLGQHKKLQDSKDSLQDKLEILHQNMEQHRQKTAKQNESLTVENKKLTESIQAEQKKQKEYLAMFQDQQQQLSLVTTKVEEKEKEIMKLTIKYQETVDILTKTQKDLLGREGQIDSLEASLETSLKEKLDLQDELNKGLLHAAEVEKDCLQKLETEREKYDELRSACERDKLEIMDKFAKERDDLIVNAER